MPTDSDDGNGSGEPCIDKFDSLYAMFFVLTRLDF